MFVADDELGPCPLKVGVMRFTDKCVSLCRITINQDPP